MKQNKTSSSSDLEFAFQVSSKSYEPPTVEVKINDVKGRMEAGSCLSANVIDESRLNKLQSWLADKITLKPTEKKLFAYMQTTPLPLVGHFKAKIKSLSTGQETTAEFLVAKETTRSRLLLGLETCKKLGILHITNKTRRELVQPEKKPINQAPRLGETNDPIASKLLEEYPDVFTGLGKHTNIKAKLIVDESAAPVIHKQRKIPYNLEKKAKAEEQQLKELGVIEEVPDSQPTTWCTNAVIALKPHKPEAIRYCSDMRMPNTAIK